MLVQKKTYEVFKRYFQSNGCFIRKNTHKRRAAIYLITVYSPCGFRVRSPPSNLNFLYKKQIGGKKMERNHPKRRKDKYNPYQIFKADGSFYVSFKDGQGILQELKINEALYQAFDEFELEDLSYLNEWDRHLEQSELYEATLNTRAFHQPESLEEIVQKRLWTEKLHRAFNELSETQKRRLILYYFDCKTYEQIAKQEGCTKRAVKFSVDSAKEKIKKIFDI